jgi:hypothetical protein
MFASHHIVCLFHDIDLNSSAEKNERSSGAFSVFFGSPQRTLVSNHVGKFDTILLFWGQGVHFVAANYVMAQGYHEFIGKR